MLISLIIFGVNLSLAQNNSDVSKIFEGTTNTSILSQKSGANNSANFIEILPNAPHSYQVMRGDTILLVASKFLKNPKQWSEIWLGNKSKNPTKLYTGDLIKIYRDNGAMRIVVTHAGKTRYSNPLLIFAGNSAQYQPRNDNFNYERPIKLYPVAIETKDDISKVQSIPAQEIEPYLNQSVIEEPWQQNRTPRILSSESGRSTLGVGDVVFAEGLDPNGPLQWEIYHPGRKISDPITGRNLGRENIHVGRAVFSKIDSRVATGKIVSSKFEIAPGDLLFPLELPNEKAYIPLPPDSDIVGNVVAVSNGSFTMTAQSYVIIINRGAQDGLVEGNVLALYRPRGKVLSFESGKKTQLPDARYGLIYVFRTFEQVSYALITESNEQITIGDIVATP